MKFCTNCGEQLKDDATECPSCGKKIRVGNPNDAVEKISDLANKFSNKAQDVAKGATDYISSQVEKQKENVYNQVQADIQSAQVKNKKPVIDESKRNEYMSSTELWSWLKKDSKRQVFYTKGGCEVSSEEFIKKLLDKIDENQVPATIECKSIEWDRSGVNKVDYFVKPITHVVNPLAYMIQFNHIGDFSFVEVKNFTTPPNLPEVPMQPLPIDDQAQAQAKMFLYGTLIIIIGFFLLMYTHIGGPLMLFGLFISFFGYFGLQRMKKIKEHNDKCARQQKAWNEAWDNWEDSIFIHSFQEDINGELSRIFDSVYECVKQVNEEIFDSKSISTDEEKISIYEMQEQIKNNRKEYK